MGCSQLFFVSGEETRPLKSAPGPRRRPDHFPHKGRKAATILPDGCGETNLGVAAEGSWADGGSAGPRSHKPASSILPGWRGPRGGTARTPRHAEDWAPAERIRNGVRQADPDGDAKKPAEVPGLKIKECRPGRWRAKSRSQDAVDCVGQIGRCEHAGTTYGYIHDKWLAAPSVCKGLCGSCSPELGQGDSVT